MDSLAAELSNILHRKTENQLKIEEFNQQIAAREPIIETIELSLAESRKIAEEIENLAITQAQTIIAEAEAVLMSRQAQLAEIHREKTLLQKELDQYSQAISKSTLDVVHPAAVDLPPSDNLVSCDDIMSKNLDLLFCPENETDTYKNPESQLEDKDAVTLQFVPRKSIASTLQFDMDSSKDIHNDYPQINSSPIITMKLVAFLNAKHYMVFADKKGITHGHSWQFQVEVEVSVEESSFVRFEDLEKYINKILDPYQRSVLNEIPPFTRIEPLTENIAALFFNRLDDDFKQFKVRLVKLTAWENPTKGIEITCRLEHFFSTGDSSKKPVRDDNVTLGQIAATDEIESKIEPVISHDQKNADYDDQSVVVNDEGLVDIHKSVLPAAESVCSHNDIEEIEIISATSIPDAYITGTDCSYKWWHYVLAILAITGVAVWAYWPILTAPLDRIYPWGSDAWSHVMKAEFYYQEILKGNYYPQFMSYWQNGTQPFRYWAPLPIGIIALMNFFFNNIFISTNYYIFICAILGGVAWLVFSKRIGFIPATLAGIIWVFWLDNLRICFSDGNIPRMLTVSLLPILLAVFIKTIEEKRYLSYFLLTLVVINIIVLCHAMIAAVYCVSLMCFAILLWIWGKISIIGLIRGGLALIAGLLSSSWWLLPSLKGGMVGMSTDAVAANIEYVSPFIAFNPYQRVLYPDTFYWGISLILLISVFILTWRYRPAWAKCLFLYGIITLTFTFPQFKMIERILPLSYILWPFRFESFWSIALILSTFAFTDKTSNISPFKKKLSNHWIIIVLAIFLLVDSYYSLRILANTRPESAVLWNCINSVEQHPGWRVATLDLSKLGSSPSYLLSSIADREQVYGWTYQGATTAQNIMLINMGIEFKWYPFVFQRLSNLGTTDLLVKDDIIKEPISFGKLAQQAGYSKIATFGQISHWHKQKTTYLIVEDKKCLAIGKYASIYAMQFPSVEIGSLQKIDEYDLKQLQKYKTIILSGASWSSQSKAEQLVTQYASSGGKVLVDLTGFPQDIMSKQAMFLGVYGEPISITKNLTVTSDNSTLELEPFMQEDWRCIAPQHLDGINLTFKHYGNTAALLGYKMINGVYPVYFLGANLAYHSFLSHDSKATKILQNVLQISENYSEPICIPTLSYQLKENGYSITYNNNSNFDALIPVAALEGMKAKVDGELTPNSTSENLITINLPAGQHTIDLNIYETSVFIWGRWVSIISILLVICGMVYIRYKSKLLACKQMVYWRPGFLKHKG